MLYANIFGLPLENVLFAKDSEEAVVNTEEINLNNLSDKEKFCIERFGKRMTLRDFASGEEVDDEVFTKILEANEFFDFSIAFDEFDNQIFDYLIQFRRVEIIKKLFNKENELHWYYKWIQRKNQLLNLALEMDDAELFEMVVSRVHPISSKEKAPMFISERQLMSDNSNIIIEKILNTENILDSLINEKEINNYDYNIFTSYNYSLFFQSKDENFKKINQDLQDYKFLSAEYKALLDYAIEVNHPKLEKLIVAGVQANNNIFKFLQERKLDLKMFSYNHEFGGMFTQYVPWPFVIAIFNEQLYSLNIDKKLVNDFKDSFERLTKGMQKSV